MKKFRHLIVLTLLALNAFMATAQTDSYFLHTVTKGQGLYSISRMYGVTEADIISINPGSDVVIKVGEQLRIPQKKNQDTGSNEQQPTATGQKFHTIKTGETLYRLTVIYNMSAREICDANPGLSAENFKVGQVIVIPSKKVEQTETSNQQKVTEPAPLIGKNNNTAVPAIESQSNCKTEHLVQRKENIYRISRMYGISELELVNANPELRERKMKVDEVLCIPYSKAEQEKKAAARPKYEEEIPVDLIVPTDEELFAESKLIPQDIEQIKAAVILPLMLADSVSSEQMKMVEFYEGVLLALDSLKKQGVSVDLHIYDSGSKWASIKPILARPEMREMNLIIGPVHDTHISEAAAFADTTGIRLVVPFARQVDAVFTNPYIYQVNTPQSYFYSEVYDHFFMQFPHPNVIFFESPE